jgi:hypothetical protein
MNAEDNIWNRDKCELLVVQLFDENGKKQKESAIKISSYIGNKDFSIWSAGEVDTWGEASFFLRMPQSVTSDWKIRALIYNPHGQKLYLDDFYIKHYQKRK